MHKTSRSGGGGGGGVKGQTPTHLHKILPSVGIDGYEVNLKGNGWRMGEGL